MGRYRAIFDGNGLLAEFEGDEAVYVRPDYAPNPHRSDHPTPMIMRDIAPYRNMIDGKMISSRSEHRELLTRHGCVEVGNEAMKTAPVQAKSTRRELIARQLGDVSDKQADKMLKALKAGR